MRARTRRFTVILVSLTSATLMSACSSAPEPAQGTGAANGTGDASASAGTTTGAGASTSASTAAGTGGSTAASSGGNGGGGNGGSTPDGGTGTGGLSPNEPPGVNFDLSLWELQEPVGQPGNPTTITPAQLAAGFHDMYFYTDTTDGAMTFWDPENGVTTANSSYPRSELRELVKGGGGANWPVAGTNKLSATVAVVKVPDHVCIGQIHLGTAIQPNLPASTKPLLELYYHATGDIVLGIEDSPSGNQTTHAITNVPLGTKLSYTIELDGDGTITLTVNGTPSTFPMPASFNGYGMYFKAGDYDQTAGSDPTVGATVKLYALQVSHGP